LEPITDPPAEEYAETAPCVPWNRRHCELQLEPNHGLIDLLNARRGCRQTSANRLARPARNATDERSVQSEISFAVSRPSSSQVAFESCRLRP
jgi:hypothetical protein